MKRITLIGCGALAHVFRDNVARVLGDAVCLLGAMSRHTEKTHAFVAPFKGKAYETIEAALADKPDLVVEFAGKAALAQYAEDVLTSGIDLVAVSVGALSDDSLLECLKGAARDAGSHLYIPNGAIGGLDILQVYGLMGGAEVTIESVKAPVSLEGAPGLQGRRLSRERRECVFDGGVAEAIAGFPKNVNVAVATALSSMTPTTRVRVVSDPLTAVNTHTIEAKNSAMQTTLRFASRPDRANPKSSQSTAWSVIALLKQLTSPVRFF